MSIQIVTDIPDAALDIVLVPGLDIGQRNWTSFENNVYWPKVLLASKIPKARILAFEYDEPPTVDVFWNKEDIISNNSNDLLHVLMHERRGEKAQRPLVFAAHCLGGLIVQDALVRASKHDKKSTIVDKAKNVLLLGTPNYNLDTISEAKKYFQLAQRKIPNDSELMDLSKHVLAIPQAFADLKQIRIMDVETFYEGSFVDINGQSIKIVEEFVARLPGDSPDPTRLNGNHHEISRFDGENRDFRTVSRILAQLAEDLDEPAAKGTVNNISFAGNNRGFQVGQSSGTIHGTINHPRSS